MQDLRSFGIRSWESSDDEEDSTVKSGPDIELQQESSAAMPSGAHAVSSEVTPAVPTCSETNKKYLKPFSERMDCGDLSEDETTGVSVTTKKSSRLSLKNVTKSFKRDKKIPVLTGTLKTEPEAQKLTEGPDALISHSLESVVTDPQTVAPNHRENGFAQRIRTESISDEDSNAPSPHIQRDFSSSSVEEAPEQPSASTNGAPAETKAKPSIRNIMKVLKKAANVAATDGIEGLIDQKENLANMVKEQAQNEENDRIRGQLIERDKADATTGQKMSAKMIYVKKLAIYDLLETEMRFNSLIVAAIRVRRKCRFLICATVMNL